MCIANIDIKINQDWTQLIAIYQQIFDELKATPAKSTYVDNWNTEMYTFGNNGMFLFYDRITDTSRTGGALYGKMVESVLPWTKQLREDLKDLNLAGIGFQGNCTSLLPHIDGQIDPNTKFHCKLNYALCSNDTITYAKDEDEVYSYPTVKDQAYLIDSSKLHWVNGNEPRHIFQLSFHQSWEEVKNWFDSHPGLRYGY